LCLQRTTRAIHKENVVGLISHWEMEVVLLSHDESKAEICLTMAKKVLLKNPNEVVNELPSDVANNPDKVDASSEFGLLSMNRSTKVSAMAKKATILDNKFEPC